MSFWGLSKQHFFSLAVLVVGSFVTLLNQTLITPALSTIMVEFSVDTATVQWLVNGFTMANAIMVPITAFLIDNYTTRRLFTIAMTFFFGGTVLAAWGPTFLVLLAGRVFQAVGAGIIMPMVMTQLMISFPVEKRGQAMGVFGLVSAVAPSIGPTISGVIIDATNWHILFYIIAVLSVFGILAGLLALKPSGEEVRKTKSIDKLSVVSSTLGLGLILYSFSAIGSTGISVPVALAGTAGLLILIYFIRRQLTIEYPMLRIEILKNKRFAIATILTVIVQAAIMCAPVLVPIYIQTIRGYSATISGLTLMPGAVLMACANPIAGKLFDKYGPRALCISGAGVVATGALVLCFFGLDTPLWLLTVVMAFRSMAVAFLNMPISTWGMNALDDSLMNHATSINNTARLVAGALGTAIIVSASSMATQMATSAGAASAEAQLYGFNVAFAVSAVVTFIGFVLCIVFVKEQPGASASAEVAKERKSTLEKIMKRDVFTVPETATVFDAVQVFSEKHVSAVPVVSVSGKAVGFISDGDIMRALSARETKEFTDPVTLILHSTRSKNENFDTKMADLMMQPVLNIGHPGIICVDIHDKLSDVCRVMGENHLKKVPVVENDKVVGVINRSDITQFALAEYVKYRDTLANTSAV